MLFTLSVFFFFFSEIRFGTRAATVRSHGLYRYKLLPHSRNSVFIFYGTLQIVLVIYINVRIIIEKGPGEHICSEQIVFNIHKNKNTLPFKNRLFCVFQLKSKKKTLTQNCVDKTFGGTSRLRTVCVALSDF